MSTVTAPPLTQKQQYLDAFEQEHQRTMRVLRNYPSDKAELRPHPKCRNARELAWTFVLEQGAAETALTRGFDWSKPPSFPPTPESFDAVLQAIERGHERLADLLQRMRDEELSETLKFPTGPGTIGDMSKAQFLWMLLGDQIHHRGQFSIYLRMADGKVPAIYGPSGDEPFF